MTADKNLNVNLNQLFWVEIELLFSAVPHFLGQTLNISKSLF